MIEGTSKVWCRYARPTVPTWLFATPMRGHVQKAENQDWFSSWHTIYRFTWKCLRHSFFLSTVATETGLSYHMSSKPPLSVVYQVWNIWIHLVFPIVITILPVIVYMSTWFLGWYSTMFWFSIFYHMENQHISSELLTILPDQGCDGHRNKAKDGASDPWIYFGVLQKWLSHRIHVWHIW